MTIKELREQQRMNQPELAVKAGVSVATVVRVERAKGVINKGTLRLLCNALGVSPDTVVGVTIRR